MEGIKNFLTYVNDNWTMLVIIAGLILSIYQKIVKYIGLSDEQKITNAKVMLNATISKYVTDAELDWNEYKHSGDIKRAEVLDRIYKDYPILTKVMNQEELIEQIKKMIDESLVTIKDVVNN